ncbi:MAG: hypothetical protein EZS28_023987 [Streblomastix strix]|uniref:Uncharacterized protein n=1 Tax=Streblomastix strix TaxID=222440 RepID=A0A5J4VDB8_9EUKA|nr:MAG: hypothetical protein EZS28_023987 [Streblomastix strix]
MKHPVQDINTELARQTHFREYFTTNDEILALSNISKIDYAQCAEDLLVQIYDTSLYEADQIVPDQVTPASDSTPQESIVTGNAGVSNEYSRSDHKHLLQISSDIPKIDTATEAIGTSITYYCSSDHQHPQQLSYDRNIITTKFIKTGRLVTELLSANGDVTTIETKLSRTYSGSGWNRSCVFSGSNNTGYPFIEFKVYSSNNAVQIIRL